MDEVTARANVTDLERLRILPRPLIDVEEIDLGVSVLGRRVAVPWLGAPTGLTGLTARARRAGGGRRVRGGRDALHRLDDGLLRDRGDPRGERRAAVVPALRVPRSRARRRPARPGARGALRGARAHGRHAAAGLARARPAQRLHDPAPRHGAIAGRGRAPAGLVAGVPARGAARAGEPGGRPRRGRGRVRDGDRPDAELARPGLGARAVGRAAGGQGRPAPRRRAARGRARRPGGGRVEPRRAPARRGGVDDQRAARACSMRWATAPRSTSTAACGAARTC